MLNVIDEFTLECLAIRVARKLKAIDVIGVLSDLFSFNARLRDELLNGEFFYTLREAACLARPPAPEVFLPAFATWPAALPRPAPPATLAQRPTLN
jgi:putative transposase